MRDQPNASALLKAFAEFYRTQVIPTLPSSLAYTGRVAGNALDIVQRELELGPSFDAAEARSLHSLLQCDGAVDALNRQLCERISQRQIADDDPQLAAHLWTTTLQKLAIDQPAYSSYQRETNKN